MDPAYFIKLSFLLAFTFLLHLALIIYSRVPQPGATEACLTSHGQPSNILLKISTFDKLNLSTKT